MGLPEEHPTRRFTDRAHNYARYRPGYPAAAVDAILSGLPPPDRLTAADIGAGTGISARLLADRGVSVFAVEPNAAMRAAAIPDARVTWVDGTAESTGLAADAFDLVTVAQAFHWFDKAPALQEFHRLLRTDGRLAIVWNRRNRNDPFTLGYCRALEAIDGEAPAERSTFDAETVASTGLFRNLRRFSYVNEHALSEGELIGRAMSTSTVPLSGPRTDTLMDMLVDLHAAHRGADGRATMVYHTEVYLWDRAA